MDIKLTLILTERGRERTDLGWERVDVIDFGYDKRGTLETVICVGEYSSKDGSNIANQQPGSFCVFPVIGDEIFEDLFANYDVEKREDEGE